MPDVIFEGYSPEEAAVAAEALRKALGVGAGGGAEVTVQESIEGLASDRLRHLLKLFKQAPEKARAALSSGGGAFEAAAAYEATQVENLHKAIVGENRIRNGQRYQFNTNHRWVRVGGAQAESQGSGNVRFYADRGPYGRGVYFPAADTAPEGLRIRATLDFGPDALLTDREFTQLDEDYGQSLDAILDRRGVGAIVRGHKDLLFVRDPDRIQYQGSLGGELPDGDYRWHLAALSRDDPLSIELVAVAEDSSLQKAAGSQMRSLSPRGVPIEGLPLPREIVRAATERCRQDGVPMGELQVKVVAKRPGFLPDCFAWCLPEEGIIYLADADPHPYLRQRVAAIVARLEAAVAADAVYVDVAFGCIQKAIGYDADWFVESCIKRYAGAILVARHCDPLSANDLSPWGEYLKLARARLPQVDRKSLAELMADDYRRSLDPHGVPNHAALEFDLGVGETLASLCQHVLLKGINCVR